MTTPQDAQPSPVEDLDPQVAYMLALAEKAYHDTDEPGLPNDWEVIRPRVIRRIQYIINSLHGENTTCHTTPPTGSSSD